MNSYACIDIGGTAIKFGMMKENGEIITNGQMDTEAQKGGAEILRKVIDIVESYKKDYPIDGIAISTAGMVDVEKGEIFAAAEHLLPGYVGIRFKQTMEERFRVPCEVENDVNCAGLAETKSGAAMGSKITVCLTIGTGIGGCLLIDGKVFHGFSGSACEVGYMRMNGSDFQTQGSGSTLSKKVAEWKNSTHAEWNGKRIFAEAKRGDAICIAAIDEMCDVLGKGIANICYVVNPQVVVLGGGIMAQEDFLRPRIEKALSKYLIDSIAKNVRLAFARHQNNAGMIGAFWNFIEKQRTENGSKDFI